MNVPFVKMGGAYNDFVVVDNRRRAVKGAAAFARKICDRKKGVGADGLLLLENSKKCDVRMRILNSDGSEAEMCGNGIRCVAKFAHDKGVVPREFSIETLAGTIRAEMKGKDVVKARLANPTNFKEGLRLSVGNAMLKGHFINTGVPHTVIFTKTLEAYDVDGLGRAVRRHRHFAPKGTNVNFVSVGPREITVRTYERGVEGETLACGTGSTASALVAAALKGFKSPVTVNTRGGEKLKVYFTDKGAGRFQDVYLEGRVNTIFKGEFPS